MFTRANGKKTRLTGEASIFISQALLMKETGSRISSMDMALKDGKMERIIKANINMDEKTERVNLCGRMGLHLKVTS